MERLWAMVKPRNLEETMGFDVVELGKDRDKEVEVRAVMVLYTKVVHHQNKGDGTRDMAE